MRAVHVATSITDSSAGTTYAVLRLCEALADRDVQIELHALEPLPAGVAKGYRATGHASWPVVRKLGIAPAMARALRRIAGTADVLHDHGLWQMPNLYVAEAARVAGRPLLYSVHGMVAPWALRRSRWKKACVSILGQRAALTGATALHATAESEYQDIRRLGLRQPVAIVPYGVDIPAAPGSRRPGRRTVLFLGRLHPVKRVDALLRAWAVVEPDFPEWDLAVCGPDNDGYLAELQQLAARLAVQRLRFTGPMYGPAKDAVFAASHLFVLPSHTENFGFVVAEALAAGVPAIVSRGAPWAGLHANDCGWWLDVSDETLAAQLRTALAMEPAALADMGSRGREWMAREHSWARVAQMMETTYGWLIGAADRPDWVRLD